MPGPNKEPQPTPPPSRPQDKSTSRQELHPLADFFKSLNERLSSPSSCAAEVQNTFTFQRPIK